MVRWYKAKCFCIAIFVCIWGSPSATQHGSIELNIPEELEPNTQVADLALEAGLASKWEPSVVDMLQYEFLQPSAQHQTFFTVNHDSGILQIAKRIDRESICAYKVTCVLKLNIVVQPFQYFEIIKVNINVLDINDNSPNFPAPEVSKSLSEASGPGTGFSIPAADDPDSPRNSIQRYDLTSGPGKFDLKVSTNPAGETKLQLVLKGRLDREVQDTYQVRLTATDGGVPARTGSLVVNIIVRDINDNIPMFMNSTYRVTVRENLPIGSVLLKVSATDPDAGLNGKVLYGFSQRTYASLGSLFGMNNFSGEIYLKAELDYEKASVYHLTVVAKDQSPDTLSIDADVMITVTDVNDHAPKISVNTFTSTGMATVSEWTKVGQFVAHIAIEDLDSGKNGQFSCSVSDSHFKLTLNSGNEFQLHTAGTFDREMQSRYNVTVTCRDWGSPQLTSTVSIVVLVLDENDNYPQFVNSPYVGSLSENNDIGASILQITANDPDLDTNGFVLFKLDGVKEEMVEITKNGLIRATAVFDYEQIQHIAFEVIAYDLGIPSRSVSTSVTINIVNVNDEPPVFAQATYYFSVTENEPVNAEVGQVSASDSDAPPFNEFGFTIKEIGITEPSSFYIDSETGTIKTKRMLDRERQHVYYLEAVAIDKGDTPMSGSVSVTVHVSDKNDNSPIIDFPNPANKSVTISASIPEGYEVTQIKAHDDDFADNKKLSFYIIDQTKEETFTIDPWTGVITLNEKLNFQGTSKKVKLNIQVKDNGLPEQHSVETSLDIVFDKSIPFIPKSPPPTGDLLGEEDAFILILSCVISVSVLLIVFLAIAIICVRKRRERHYDYSYPGTSNVKVKVAGHHDQVRSFSRLPSPMTPLQNCSDSGLGLSDRRTPTDNSAILYHYQGSDSAMKKAMSLDHNEIWQNKPSRGQESSSARSYQHHDRKLSSCSDTKSGGGMWIVQNPMSTEEDTAKPLLPGGSRRRDLERGNSACASTVDSGHGASLDGETLLGSHTLNQGKAMCSHRGPSASMDHLVSDQYGEPSVSKPYHCKRHLSRNTPSTSSAEVELHDPPPDYPGELMGAQAQDFNRDGPEGESLKKLLYNFPQMMAKLGGSNLDIEGAKGSDDQDNQSSLTSSINSNHVNETNYHGTDPGYHANDSSYHSSDHGYHGRKHSHHSRKKRRSYNDGDLSDFMSKRRSYNDGSDVVETSSFEEFKFNSDMEMDEDHLGYVSDMEQQSDVSSTLKPGNGDGEENASSFDTDDTPDSKTGRKPITA